MDETPSGDADEDSFSNADEYANGSSPADFFNGQTPIVLITSGDDQTGPTSDYFAIPLVIEVRNAGHITWDDCPVTFTVIQGGGELGLPGTGGEMPGPSDPRASSQSVRTGDNEQAPGHAAVYYYGASSAGSAVVQVTAGPTSVQFDLSQQARTATPTISPSGGTFAVLSSVELACADSGAQIYYTLDGSDPVTSSTKVLYSSAISINRSLTMKAAAIDSGKAPSLVASASFAVTGMIAAGGKSSFVVTADGQTWVGGDNASGQLGLEDTGTWLPIINSSLAGAQQIATGGNFTLVLNSSGQVLSFGSDASGQLGNGSGGSDCGIPPKKWRCRAQRLGLV